MKLAALLSVPLGVVIWLVVANGIATHDLVVPIDEVEASTASWRHEVPASPRHVIPPELEAEFHGPVAVRLVNHWDAPIAQEVVRVFLLPLKLSAFVSEEVHAYEPAPLARGALPKRLPRLEHVARTDAEGLARFDDLPYDGSWGVVVDPDDRFFREERIERTRNRITAPDTIARVNALPLRVRAEAAESGRSLHSAYTLKPALGTETSETGASARRCHVAVGRGEHKVVALKFKRPGRVQWEQIRRRVRVSPGARSLSWVQPLRPLAKVFVRDRVDIVASVHGQIVRKIRAESVPDSPGWIELKGVPFVPHAELEVETTSWSDFAIGSSMFGFDPKAEALVELQLGVDISDRNSYIGYPRPAWAHDPARFEAKADAPAQGAFELLESDNKARKTTLVELRVQRADGKPAIGAQVRLKRRTLTTDSVGRVIFSDVEPGTYPVAFLGAGPSWRASLTLAAVSRQLYVVRLPKAGQLNVAVVNEKGKPLPYARFRLWQGSGLPWHDVLAGDQRIDPFVGADGKRTLYNVQPDTEIRLHVAYAGRDRWLRTRVGPGQARSIVVDMDAPNDDKLDAAAPKR